MKDKLKNIALIFTLVLLLVTSLTVMELVRRRAYYVRETPPKVSVPVPELTFMPEITELPAPAESPEATIKPEATEAPVAREDAALNLLIVGSDGMKGAEGALDTLAAARYDKEGGRLKLILLSPRLYVDIPGHGWGTLLRAYELGGMKLLGRTLGENFGIELDGCLVADYRGLGAVVDALGGIDVELTVDEAARLGLSEGINRLNGEQALAYMAFDEDGEGGKRRLSLILSVAEAAGSLDGLGLLKLAYAALPFVSTDMSRTEILACALGVYRGGIRSLELYSLPFEDKIEGEEVDGIPVIRIDIEENRRLLGEWLYGG